ncbi:MAG TPA: Holliday junction branch migration DNA helicase RuvB, partial [Myxococcales bacterium]|nr:Holliday junction branch migration DNA helicase RuvB [Myxococcales bacterium]
NRLVRRVRDFAEVEGEGLLDLSITQHALTRLGIDEIGLDALDNEYLRRLIETFEGGPVGIDTLAAAIGEESGTLEDVCEPYLIQIGFLKRSPRGRVATSVAKKHWGAFGSAGQTLLPNI